MPILGPKEHDMQPVEVDENSIGNVICYRAYCNREVVTRENVAATTEYHPATGETVEFKLEFNEREQWYSGRVLSVSADDGIEVRSDAPTPLYKDAYFVAPSEVRPLAARRKRRQSRSSQHGDGIIKHHYEVLQ
eukprot:COSAG02_NODE_25418_length_659_cov_1.275000_2_plen_133_part_01